MKYLFAIGTLVLLLSFAVPVSAEEINFICKNDCLSRGGNLGYCNSLCSTTSGGTKNPQCMSECTKQGGTYYNCSKECTGKGGSGESGGESQPTQNRGDRPAS